MYTLIRFLSLIGRLCEFVWVATCKFFPSMWNLTKTLYPHHFSRNQRDIDIYHQSSSSSFGVLAASAVGGTTTCLTGITKVCSGSSTPRTGEFTRQHIYSSGTQTTLYVPKHIKPLFNFTGKKPFFYVTCGATTYVGPDPYALSPYDNFPNHGNTTNIVRSYVCKGQQSTRPTWKLLGFFNPDECTSAQLPDTATYAEGICNLL